MKAIFYGGKLKSIKDNTNLKNFVDQITKKHKFILFLLTIVVLFWRRPGQFLYPYIWAEDGAVILRDFLTNGYGSISMPVAGYFITSTKLINFLAYKISFWYYPEIASFLSNAFIVCIVFAIAYSPTKLKCPYLCAILTLFVKTRPECFGTALYSFWWVGLLLILVSLWNEEGKMNWLRIFYLLFAGLSSPLIAICSPLLAFRALLVRKKNEFFIFLISLIPFSIQMLSIFSSTRDLSENYNLKWIIIKFLSPYTFSSLKLEKEYYFILGLVFLVLLILPLFFNLKFKRLPNIKMEVSKLLNEKKELIILLAWLSGSIYLSCSAIDINIIDHINAGARYYFYPFIIISYILIHNFYIMQKNYLRFIYLFIAFTFIFDGSLKIISQDHIKENWRLHLQEIYNNYRNEIPIFTGGQSYKEWRLKVSKNNIENLINNSVIFNNYGTNSYGYSNNLPNVSIDFTNMHKNSDSFNYAIDLINNKPMSNQIVINQGDRLTIDGWGLDNSLSSPTYTTYIKINNVLFECDKKVMRQDANSAYGINPNFLLGYSFSIDYVNLPKGLCDMSIIFISADSKSYGEFNYESLLEIQ